MAPIEALEFARHFLLFWEQHTCREVLTAELITHHDSIVTVSGSP
jgi:hypothetical protein